MYLKMTTINLMRKNETTSSRAALLKPKSLELDLEELLNLVEFMWSYVSLAYISLIDGSIDINFY